MDQLTLRANMPTADRVWSHRSDKDIYTNTRRTVYEDKPAEVVEKYYTKHDAPPRPNLRQERDHILEIQLLDAVFFNSSNVNRTQQRYCAEPVRRVVNSLGNLNMTIQSFNLTKRDAFTAMRAGGGQTYRDLLLGAGIRAPVSRQLVLRSQAAWEDVSDALQEAATSSNKKSVQEGIESFMDAMDSMLRDRCITRE